MRTLLFKIEKMLVRNNPECQFELQFSNHVIILPGLGGYVGKLFPLVRFLRKNQKNYGITAMPLGLSSASFSIIVSMALENIEENLFKKSKVNKIIFLGHSFGGRVACMLMNEIKKKYSEVIYEVITLGSPVGFLRPNKFPWYLELLFSCFSRAYREGSLIIQPDQKMKYVGFYSIDDELVYPELAKAGHNGTLIELKGFLHDDLISPKEIGDKILELLK